MSRFALFDLSHQKNLNSQTPGAHHSKNYLQQSQSSSSDSKQLFPHSNVNNNNSSTKQYISNQATSNLNGNFKSTNTLKPNDFKDTSFFIGGAGNMTQSDRTGYAGNNPQIEPVQHQFSRPYQIFESMITDEIKELQDLFRVGEISNLRQQRREAFGCLINVKELEEAVSEGPKEFKPNFYMLNPQSNNALKVPDIESSYDKEAAKRSIHELSASFEQLQDSILSAELEISLTDDYIENQEKRSEYGNNIQKKGTEDCDQDVEF